MVNLQSKYQIRKCGKINDVLPLKATQRCAIANVKCFGALGHQQPNFDGCVYINYAAPLYSARIRAIYLLLCFQSLVGLHFLTSVCNAKQ